MKRKIDLISLGRKISSCSSGLAATIKRLSREYSLLQPHKDFHLPWESCLLQPPNILPTHVPCHPLVSHDMWGGIAASRREARKAVQYVRGAGEGAAEGQATQQEMYYVLRRLVSRIYIQLDRPHLAYVIVSTQGTLGKHVCILDWHLSLLPPTIKTETNTR